MTTPLKVGASLFLILVSSSLISRNVSAEIFNCEGKWTNKACQGNVKESVEERPLDPRATDPNYKARREFVKFLYRYELAMRKRGVTVPLAPLEKFCMADQRKAEDCALEFAAIYPDLEKQAEKIEEERKKQELLDEVRSARAEAEAAKQAAWDAAQEARNLQGQLSQSSRSYSCHLTPRGNIDCQSY